MGWSDPRFTLATEPCAKVGSLQPIPVSCPCPKSTPEQNATSMFPTESVYRRGERNAEPQGEPCLSRTVHLSPAEESFEFHWDPRASTPTEASETKNVKDKLRPAPGEFSGFHRFLILVCGPVLESSAHLHPSKQLDISVNSPHILRGPPKGKTSLRIL